MKASVEISMYPLKEEYIPEIKEFIGRLKNNESIECQINGMSTQIFGDYRLIMEILTNEIAASFEKEGKFVFVMKVINGYLKKQ